MLSRVLILRPHFKNNKQTEYPSSVLIVLLGPDSFKKSCLSAQEMLYTSKITWDLYPPHRTDRQTECEMERLHNCIG